MKLLKGQSLWNVKSFFDLLFELSVIADKGGKISGVRLFINPDKFSPVSGLFQNLFPAFDGGLSNPVNPVGHQHDENFFKGVPRLNISFEVFC